ncbi:translational activator of cytochrome c oxidase 1 isoform X2 [Dunckerocampus dactyliophorus]|nr:translational activator of cytochrome c oxidase 1 isoform X2 [Dunckerocampus dactyliophorus]XP_054623052.1 translational activator of cytochrome c oxidase 1 isoform X2 [Dunckerocampus dactyliophorus]XP_054623054.1 translational activator of cytochrome c oxidase 1 isoform X2 [Dunckerocampus dactyliophorus]
MTGRVVLGSVQTLRLLNRVATTCILATRCEPTLQEIPGAVFPLWRTLHQSPALCAGHNKWSKVKHIKGPKDEERSRLIMKFGLMIKTAVKEGGPNPDMNVNLANILEQCRNKNIPKASIEAAIKNAGKPASPYMLEARGPGGCFLLIEVLTDQPPRSQQEVRRVLTKNGDTAPHATTESGMLSQGVSGNFSRRGVVVVPGQNITLDRALELAIEAGAEDVEETTDEDDAPILQFICDTVDLWKVQASLQRLGMQVTSVACEFVPRTILPLDQEQLDAASTLIEALSDVPDVVRIWDNIQVSS